MSTKRSTYLLKQLKIPSLTLFHTRQILCDERDPPSIGNIIKKLSNEKKYFIPILYSNGQNEQLFQVFQANKDMLLSATKDF